MSATTTVAGHDDRGGGGGHLGRSVDPNTIKAERIRAQAAARQRKRRARIRQEKRAAKERSLQRQAAEHIQAVMLQDQSRRGVAADVRDAAVLDEKAHDVSLPTVRGGSLSHGIRIAFVPG